MAFPDFSEQQLRLIAGGLFAVLIGSLLLAGLVMAASESSVSTSVQSSASGGSSSSESSSVVEVNGQTVQNTSIASSGSIGVAVRQSNISGGGSADLDTAVQTHFSHLGRIVNDLPHFGVPAALTADAQATLRAEQTQWAQASTAEQKTRLIEQMNAYWAGLRQSVKDSGAAYDFDAQLSVDNVGGVTVVSSGSGSVGTSSSGAVQSDASGPADALPSAVASGASQPSAHASSGFAEVLVQSVSVALAQAGLAFTAVLDAALRLFR